MKPERQYSQLKEEEASSIINEQQRKQSNQFKALFIKNLHLQKKQMCTNICQIVTPLICLIFSFLIKQLATENIPGGNTLENNYYPFVFNNFTLFDQYNKIIEKGQITDRSTRSNPKEWFIYRCQQGCDKNILGQYNGSQLSTRNKSQMLPSIGNTDKFSHMFYPNYFKNQSQTLNQYLPFFFEANSTIDSQIFTRLKTIQTGNFTYIKKGGPGLDYLPDGTIDFLKLSETGLKAIIKANDARDLDLHRRNNLGIKYQMKQVKGAPGQYANTAKEVAAPYNFLEIMHLISQSFLNYKTKVSVQSGYILMPALDQGEAFVDSLINTASALIFPLGLSLLFPVMLYGIVLEKEQRLVQMMKMNGMKIRNYWLVFFTYNFVICLITNLIFFILGALVLKTSFFTKTDPLLLFIVALGWILAQIGLAAFFQTFLSKSRTANILGYILAIWTSMISSTLSIGVYQYPSSFPLSLQWIPPFSFNRLFYLMLINCSDYNCYQSIDSIKQEMKTQIMFLYLSFIFFFGLGAYLFEVIPQEFGVARHPLFPFKDFYRFITCKKGNSSFALASKDQELKKYVAEFQEDPNSKSERQFISKLEDFNKYPLVINNLRKLFKKEGKKSDFVAVKSFNLKVDHKQTFGLLGPNGAGKTTLISMLTGMTEPNYGNAWIGGYDIISNIAKSQLQMGVCPQFDLLWPQMTVEEHLYFYARLKGVPSKQVEQKVENAIEEVNLTQFKNFQSKSLSGGMKRRLSIAISLVGNPQIVFLDEPSSGLDPDNRRQLWQVLVKCQQKRSLFLTTHMMQQADTLCHRIGIITHGTLRTVGNQLKLKKQYGEGFRLNINLIKAQRKLVSRDSLNKGNFNDEDEEEKENHMRKSIHELVNDQSDFEKIKFEKVTKKIQKFVNQRFPGSALKRVYIGSIVFKIPSEFKISKIFEEMHDIEKELDIADISITNSSLEDVFVNVVVKYDKYIDDDEEEEHQERQNQALKSIKYQKSEQEIIEQEIEKAESVNKKSQDQQSIVVKNRVSIMSEEEYRQNNELNQKDDDDQ